jgi:hypothetical protein
MILIFGIIAICCFVISYVIELKERISYLEERLHKIEGSLNID